MLASTVCGRKSRGRRPIGWEAKPNHLPHLPGACPSPALRRHFRFPLPMLEIRAHINIIPAFTIKVLTVFRRLRRSWTLYKYFSGPAVCGSFASQPLPATTVFLRLLLSLHPSFFFPLPSDLAVRNSFRCCSSQHHHHH